MVKTKKFMQLFADETYGELHHTNRYVLDELNKYDSLITAVEPQKIKVSDYGETDRSKKTRPLNDYIEHTLEEGPLFRYFLDGTRRTYKISDISYQQTPFAVVGGQVSVGCCERINKRSFKPVIKEYNSVLCVPNIASEDGENPDQWLKEILPKLNKECKTHQNFKVDKILAYSSRVLEEGQTYEKRGIARIHELMVDSEKKIVVKLASQRLLTDQKYLLKDGSLEYSKRGHGEFLDLVRIKNNFRRVVGVSKSFNPESLIERNRSIGDDIADLPPYHRTPAYKYQSKHTDDQIFFSVWYLRIRDRYLKMSSPFEGVLKVEKILTTDTEIDEGLDTDEVNRISSNLIVERNPTTYGKDSRWTNHLYPIYVTETYVKSQLISEKFFISTL